MWGPGGLPGEVAACLSYFAGRNLPRRRGRIFLGPLANNALLPTATGPVVEPGFINTVVERAAGLITQSATADVRWHMLSTRDANAFRITGGWMDNAFDTLRGRGAKATERIAWGAQQTG